MQARHPAAHFALAAAVVYRCTIEGVTVFADRPCEPQAAPYAPDTSRVSTYTPPPASPAAKAAPSKPHRSRARAAVDKDQARRAATCERLRASLKDIAARMRAGYDARQGERLRERKARLEAQRRAQKCR